MKTNIIVVAIFLVIAYAAFASPNGQPVMSALVGIQNAIMTLGDEPEQPEKEWYHERFVIDPCQNDALFIVPEGRQFVLRRLYSAPDSAHQTDWHLATNETLLLDGSINKYSFALGSNITYKFVHDFPDGCITVDANNILNAVNKYSSGGLNIIVIGYFQNMP